MIHCIKNFLVFIVAISTLGLVVPATQAAVIISTFDSGVEGWSVSGTDGEVLSQVGSGGNPDGYAEIADVGANMSLAAPAAFLGDLSAYDGGTFSWDGKAFDEGTGAVPGSYAYGEVIVTGTAGTATHSGIPSANRPTFAGGWTDYSLDFTAADFGVSQGTWDAILADVTSISLGGNAWTGFETLGYDNIALATVTLTPEPSTLGLMAMGAGLLYSSRKRKQKLV